ncbi:alpha/beta hydrolase [Dietzia sp. ANT_WB102]|uniref:alpha/beta hydrolase n=1 Tax=Dietzia sp. ANT_WB102 TaxID=2597345 RepID=UPI0011EBD71C|nr:alpha/beta hydrolase [Dietzia sp. ANT_WB102]KAA0918486.1 alpha/beta hydrolase [Dietzia sp. ANT_WB102]
MPRPSARVPLPVLIAPAAVSAALALRPIRRPFAAATAGWVWSLPAQELPLHVGAVVGAATAPVLARRRRRASDRVGVGMAALTWAGLGVVVARHLAARAALDRALREGLSDGGAGGAGGVTTRATTTSPLPLPRTPWPVVLLRPWPLRPREVRARRGMIYGPDPTANRFDLYTGADGLVEEYSSGATGRAARGVLIHIHGGHFRAGGPSRESRAMLFDHARRGWAAISTTYHLSSTPESGFPQHLVDIKRLIHWVRTEGPSHGIPAGAPIVVAGSSAGAHIAMMAALTAGDARFQPGFTGADTAIDGAVGLYGYYGRLGRESKDISDPVRHPATSAPPVAIIHGTHDTYTPVKGSRRLVRHLRSGSPNPVVYAELRGAQHGFDAVRSPRYLAVVEAVARFTDHLA